VDVGHTFLRRRHGRAAWGAQGDMQTARFSVTLIFVSPEHRLDAPPRRPDSSASRRSRARGLVRDAILRVVEMMPRRLRGQALTPRRVLGEERAGGATPDLLLMGWSAFHDGAQSVATFSSCSSFSVSWPVEDGRLLRSSSGRPSTTRGRRVVMSARDSRLGYSSCMRARLSVLRTLTPEQRRLAAFAIDTPSGSTALHSARARGLPLKAMDDRQRAARPPTALLRAVLSDVGYRKATDIMRLETVLRAIETVRRSKSGTRSTMRAVFGDPR